MKTPIAQKLDDLYNSGTGSWDTINGKRVVLACWWSCKFQIDNQFMYLDDAIEYLSR